MPKDNAKTGATPPTEREAPGTRLRVLPPLPVGGYDYRAPAGLALAPGDFVRVPLGPREITAVVWDAGKPGGREIAESKLREVIEKYPLPPLGADQRRFIDWVAAYCMAAPGAVLRMTIGLRGLLEPLPQRTVYSLGGAPPARLTAARHKVLALLGDGRPRSVAEIADQAAVGPGVVRGLIKAGALIAARIAATPPLPVPDGDCEGPRLSVEQQQAADALTAAVGEGGFSVSLLEGVTGSGKTEVYFEAIAAALKKDTGAQILVLLPEIALTSQWLARFEERFGTPPVEWHSELGAARRRHHWRAVAEGRARVVVGARSALFLPFASLALIVIDEEHDSAFKQEDGVIYQARDMAVVRASITGCPLVLASATPSLETLNNVATGRYRRLHLPNRHGGALLPDIDIVDLRKTPPKAGQWLAPPLIEALAATFAAGEQAILFLNRRGYAPLTLCRHCGHRLKCPHCSAWLVEHRFVGTLQCHHCDYRIPLPAACPSCGTADSLAPCGPGVERMAEEAARLFPEARLAVMASDTMHGPRAVADLVRRIEEGSLDLVIGTQIITKGYHFPMLTTVGVVDADLGLAGGDLRAAERCYQQLSQVAGRAGRGERPGRVLMQTWMPEQPVIEALASGNVAAFLERESDERRAAGLPPFGRLAALVLSAPELSALEEAGRLLAGAAPLSETIAVFGPAPAPLALIRGRHRARFLIKARRRDNLQRFLRRWLKGRKLPPGVRLKIDIDPYSFL